MRILVLGATGLVGRVLLQEWRDDTVIGMGSKDADLRDPDRVHHVFGRTKPEVVVLLAAYTDVDGCEDNPALARSVNTQGAEDVGKLAVQSNCRLVFISTDYVFSGTKDSPYGVNDLPAPLNVYGRTKADAEQRLQSLMPDVCIVRTSWVFGVHGKCFPTKILEAASTQQELRVVGDQRGCPTFNRDLARAIVQLVRTRATGIVHVTNGGECSWFEFAQYLLREAGVRDTALRVCSTSDSPRPARRPRYSVLSSASAHERGIFLPNWQSAVRAYLAERAAGQKAQATAP